MRGVTVSYYRRRGSSVEESFVIDVATAIERANAAGNRAGARRIRELWLDHFDVTLPAMGSANLIAYLESRSVWRNDGEWSVFKTVDEPCIAYTAQIGEDNQVTLVALGACYRYPSGSEENWWTQTIRPRVRTLIG